MFDGERCIRCRKGFRFEELGVAPGGFSICRECEKRLRLMKDAPGRLCLADGAKMKREALDGRLFFDRCPSCGGVWLDGEEVELIKRYAGERYSTDLLSALLAAL